MTAGNTVALECLLRDTDVDVEAKSTQLQWTALHVAARAGATDAASLLIKHGADIRTLGRASRDAAPGACSAIAVLLCSINFLNLFMCRNSLCFIADNVVTPVQLATMHAHADCERLLRDRERDSVQLAGALCR